MRVTCIVALSGVVLATMPASADPAWMWSVEAPAAVPLSEPQTDRFDPGALPALGVYRALGNRLLLGGRLRAGVLTNGQPPDMELADPGLGGLGSAVVSLRLRPLDQASRSGDGLWLELAGGGAITGDNARPTAEAGIGYGFAAGSLSVGPSLRYVRVQQLDNVLDGRSADLALLGVELSMSRERARPAALVADPVPAPVVVTAVGDRDRDGLSDDVDDCPDEPEDVDGWQDEDGCPDPDDDGDGILDAMDACPREAEVVNAIDDEDGCPDEGVIVVNENRIILEERVLFELERARVRTSARPALQAIRELWKQHPEYDRMIIEGHADERGPDSFNDKLSEERAKRVRQALVELGMPAEQIDVIGYGKRKPASTGSSDADYQRNRRVEFVIIEKQETVEGRKLVPEKTP